jgi:Na+/melibiose symporter-like transporter
MLTMRDLTPEERKRVQQVFSKAMMFPGFAISFVGIMLNVLVGRNSHGVAVPIIVLVLCVSGLAIGLTMGFSARRRELAAVEAERQKAAPPPPQIAPG